MKIKKISKDKLIATLENMLSKSIKQLYPSITNIQVTPTHDPYIVNCTFERKIPDRIILDIKVE